MFNSKFGVGVLKHPGYNVGGGIGEAALIGAAFGGAKSIATGEDPLKGALLGGLTGGAMSGIGGALFGGAGGAGANTLGTTATDVVGQEAKDVATQQMMDSSLNMVKPYAPEIGGISTAQGVGALPQAGITGSTGEIGANMGIVNPAVSGGYTAGQAIPAGVDVHQGIADANRLADMKAAGSVNGNIAPQSVAGESGLDWFNKPGLDVTQNGITDPNSTAGKAAQWWKDQGIGGRTMYAGLGGLGYGMLNPNIPKQPEIVQEKSKLAGYDPENFTRYVPAQPNPYPHATYAQGGIAALANGGMDSSSPVGTGMGDNSGFPGARLDLTQYATPSQMPTSNAVVGADYEQATNPYTGEPVNMASGGTATGGQVYYDSASGKYYTQTNPGGFMNMGPDSIFSTMFGGFANDPAMNSNDPTSPFWNGRTYLGGSPTGAGEFQASQVTPEVYQQPTYASQPTTTAVSSTIPSYALADSMPLLQASNPELAARMSTPAKGMAAGGIAGYSLGGYADGGIPHLLKGPGDGMSDSIPATIGSKQPARLATGEFVVPADVVSHLGNGSTDAGAKHLYAMMDKVRTARTGRKSQGKQINASNYLPA